MSKRRNYVGGDRVFLLACELAGTAPTRRQFSKYSRKIGGKALAKKQDAILELAKTADAPK
jgi:hypothetical protein